MRDIFNFCTACLIFYIAHCSWLEDMEQICGPVVDDLLYSDDNSEQKEEKCRLMRSAFRCIEVETKRRDPEDWKFMVHTQQIGNISRTVANRCQKESLILCPRFKMNRRLQQCYNRTGVHDMDWTCSAIEKYASRLNRTLSCMEEEIRRCPDDDFIEEDLSLLGNWTERLATCATTPAIHTGPTAPSTGTQERNDLDCSGGRMRIHVPQTLLPTHIVTLRDPSCKVASNGSHLLADVGVNECGTTVSFTNDSVIFTNELVATALSGTTAPTIIDYGMNMKDQRVKISCIYPRENRVDFSYVPVMKEAHFYERQYGKLSFDVSQYSDEQFSHVIPHNGLPIGVTLNTELFIDISLRHASHKGVGIMVDSCIATPTSSPADPLWYTVIKDGCPAQQDVRTFASPDVDEFRFSFLVFRFTQAPLQKAGPNLPPTSMVFIHCQVSACPSQNCTNNCNPAGSHRVRREAELENSHLVSAGPFYLKSEEERGGYTGGVVAASVSVAVVATLVAIVALVAWRRSVNKLSKHQTLDEAS